MTSPPFSPERFSPDLTTSKERLEKVPMHCEVLQIGKSWKGEHTAARKSNMLICSAGQGVNNTNHVKLTVFPQNRETDHETRIT